MNSTVTVETALSIGGVSVVVAYLIGFTEGWDGVRNARNLQSLGIGLLRLVFHIGCILVICNIDTTRTSLQWICSLTTISALMFLMVDFLRTVMSPIIPGKMHFVDLMRADMTGQMSDYDRFRLEQKV
jgi:hypothetical protein